MAGAEALSARLACDDAVVWRTAAGALERMGEVGARALAARLADGLDSASWGRAAGALRRMGAMGAGAELLQLTDREDHIRRSRAGALGLKGPLAAPHAATLANRLEHRDALERKRAMEAITELGEVGAAALAGRLGSSHGFVRRRALEGLLQMEAAGLPHGEAVRGRLKDPNPWVRWKASEAAFRTGCLTERTHSRGLPHFNWPHRDHELGRST
uniref:HEAT repeat domain-containing protein n=1 Tax=Pyrodinium bahamense TaxID=73915 RepID=A0A7S0B1A6_9DINO